MKQIKRRTFLGVLGMSAAEAAGGECCPGAGSDACFYGNPEDGSPQETPGVRDRSRRRAVCPHRRILAGTIEKPAAQAGVRSGHEGRGVSRVAKGGAGEAAGGVVLSGGRPAAAATEEAVGAEARRVSAGEMGSLSRAVLRGAVSGADSRRREPAIAGAGGDVLSRFDFEQGITGR